MFINQSPDVKPFLGLVLGTVEGGATASHRSGGTREAIRNLRQVLRMRPVFIYHVVLRLHRHPVPSHVPVIDTEGGRKNRSTWMGEGGIRQGSREERVVFPRIR